jgi:hypothetical protein
VIAILGKSGIDQVGIRLDDRKVPNPTKTMDRLDEFQVTPLPHPSYSPNISSFNFLSFGWRKGSVQAQWLQRPEAI